MKRFFLALLFLAAGSLALSAPLASAKAEPSQAAVAQLIEESKEVQGVYIEVTQLLFQLIGSEAGLSFSEWGTDGSQIVYEQTLQALAASRAALPDLQNRVNGLVFTPMDEPKLDAALASSLEAVRNGPVVLGQLNDIIARKIAFAEAGDRAGYDALDGALGHVVLNQHDLEIAMTEVGLAAQRQASPQNGLSRAQLASLQGMRALIVIQTLDQSEIWPALEALPAQLSVAAQDMRQAIDDGHRAGARLASGSLTNQALAAMGIARGAQQQAIKRLVKEYDEALDVEAKIADLLDSNAALFQRLVEGDESDDLIVGIDANDVLYEQLIGERQREAQERVLAAQALVE